MGIPGNAMVFLVMYVVATIMLNASLVFYDAFLIDATDSEDRYDEVDLRVLHRSDCLKGRRHDKPQCHACSNA